MTRNILFPFLFILSASFVSAQNSSDAVIEQWLKNSASVSSLKMRFSQNSSLKTVRAPIAKSGTLYVDMRSKRFRWDTGTMVIFGNSSSVTISKPSTKQYEVRSTSGSNSGIGALARGLPKSLSSFKRSYNVLKVSKSGSSYSILTQPKGSSSKGVNTMTFKVSASSYSLTGISVVMRDGSRISSSFSGVQKNPKIPSSFIKPSLSGYQKTTF